MLLPREAQLVFEYSLDRDAPHDGPQPNEQIASPGGCSPMHRSAGYSDPWRTSRTSLETW